MKNIAIICSVTIIFAVYMYYVYYTNFLMKLHKQKIDIFRYKIAGMMFKNRNYQIFKAESLKGFIENTYQTIELNIDDYLPLMRLVKANINKSGENNVKPSGLKEEILQLINSKHISKDEEEFILDFINLQTYITSIKKPLKYIRINLRNQSEAFFYEKIIKFLFNGYAQVYMWINKNETKIVKRFGNYEYTSKRRKKKITKDVFNIEGPTEQLGELNSLALQY